MSTKRFKWEKSLEDDLILVYEIASRDEHCPRKKDIAEKVAELWTKRHPDKVVTVEQLKNKYYTLSKSKGSGSKRFRWTKELETDLANIASEVKDNHGKIGKISYEIQKQWNKKHPNETVTLLQLRNKLQHIERLKSTKSNKLTKNKSPENEDNSTHAPNNNTSGKAVLHWSREMEDHLQSAFDEYDKNTEKTKSKDKMLLELWHKKYPDIKVTAKQLKNKRTRLSRNHYIESEEKLSSTPLFDQVCYGCGMLLYGSVSDGHKFTRPIEELIKEKSDVEELFCGTALEQSLQIFPKPFTYSCRLCKNEPVHSYNISCTNPLTGKQDIPSPLLNLNSYEKGMIALSGIFSSTLKKANTTRKIWEHRLGETNILSKTKTLYEGMYGFLVSKDNDSNSNRAKISNALLWLRQNNPLYESFFSKSETLYGYFSSTTNMADNETTTTRLNEPVTSQLGAEKEAICIPFEDEKSLPTTSANKDVAGVQHPQDGDHLLTKTHYNDTYLEAKAWPHLFPYSTGSWHYSTGMPISDYVKYRLLNLDNRWRRDPNWSFFFFDRMIKQRILYTAKCCRVRKNIDDLNVGKIRKMYSSKDESNPYSVYGSSVPPTIQGSRGYWSSKLLDLLAMSREFGTPSFMITLTQNDNWPEIKSWVSKTETGINSDSFSCVNFPVETIVAFHKRFHAFRKEVLSNDKGPLGKVSNYWYRVEFQKRGALHIHMVVWCSNIPENAVVAELPRGDLNDPQIKHKRDMVTKFQIHGECSPERCFKGSNGKVFENCKYGFPFKIQDNECLDKAKMRYLYPRSLEEDSRVVPYNMDLLLLWGAHLNVQKMVDGGWELYCAKYVAKAEPTFDIKLPETVSDPERYLRTRICGRLEVDSSLLGYPMCSSSRDVIYLPTEVSPKYGFLKRRQHLPEDPDSKDIFYENLLDKYLARPKQLENVLYPDFVRKYRYTNSGENPKQRVFVDVNGRNIVTRVEGREVVPRWRFILPYGEDQEKYFEQKLLLNVPFTSENISEIISKTNDSGSYMEECVIRGLCNSEQDAFQTLNAADKRGFSIERIAEIARNLVSCGWIDSAKAEKFLKETEDNRPSEMFSVEVSDSALTTEEGVLGNLQTERKMLDLSAMIGNLSATQLQAFNYIKTAILKQQTLCCVVGGAGTGKSYLINTLVAFLHTSSKFIVQKLATTGVAAFLIGGTTIHNFFKMDVECNSYLEKGTAEFQLLKDTDVIIIDEFSLLEKKVFHKIDYICRCVSSGGQKANAPFGGKHVFLVGDPAQLPAIEKDIFETDLFKRFSIVLLQETQRQKDVQFLTVLNEVRLGILSTTTIDLLKSRLISSQDEITLNGPIIVSLRKDRDLWNTKFLEKMEGEEFSFPAIDTDGNGNEISEIEKKKIMQYHRERLPDNLRLKIGAKVILLKNIDVQSGWVNGTLAKVTSIKNDYIFIENEANGKKLVVSRMKQNLAFRASTSGIVRQQFPLNLGWALTVHKVQGMTLEQAYIQLDSSFFASGQAYVALSRLKSTEGLHLISFSEKAILLDPFYKDLLEWMESVNAAKSSTKTLPYPVRQSPDKPTPSNKLPDSKKSPSTSSSKTPRSTKPLQKHKMDTTTNDLCNLPCKAALSVADVIAKSHHLNQYLHPSMREFYSVQNTPPDGNCLWHSFSIFLTGNILLTRELKQLTYESLLQNKVYFENQLRLETVGLSYEEILQVPLSENEWGNEYHIQSLAFALKRPVFVYTSFKTSSGQYFFPNHNYAELCLEFQNGTDGTRQHLVYWPINQSERANRPVTIFFYAQHYSSISANTDEFLIPTTSLFMTEE